MKKIISVLGATGSVGRQALDVARERDFLVDFLCANRDAAALESYAREFRPRAVAMADPDAARDLKSRLADTSVKVLAGDGGIEEGILSSESETVVNSILGEAGLKPTLAVIKSGKRLALANKESLVIAGDIVMAAAREKGVEIIPVDSEHSAIFQSLKSGKQDEIKRIILTASGGPFFGKTREELDRVTLAETLAHPTWKMGKKITVDSATLMNKGFEIIEAVHLFGVPADKVEVVVHRESILHSAVEYIDRAVVAQMGVPDMRLCVQYAMTYPCRVAGPVAPLDLFQIGTLTFEKPDMEAFPLLSLAYRSVKVGGAMTAALNAANEVAVAAFLEDRIRFADLFEIVGESVAHFDKPWGELSLEELLAADRRARELARDGVARRAGSV